MMFAAFFWNPPPWPIEKNEVESFIFIEGLNKEFDAPDFALIFDFILHIDFVIEISLFFHWVFKTISIKNNELESAWFLR